MKMLKCVKCGKEAEYICVGLSLCGECSELSLRTVLCLRPISPPTPFQSTITPPTTAKEAAPKISVNDVEKALATKAGYVTITETANIIFVKPNGFLGADIFAAISSIVKEFNGTYKSAGKESHWEIQK